MSARNIYAARAHCAVERLRAAYRSDWGHYLDTESEVFDAAVADRDFARALIARFVTVIHHEHLTTEVLGIELEAELNADRGREESS